MGQTTDRATSATVQTMDQTISVGTMDPIIFAVAVVTTF
jgi:hypothetical protein